MQTRWHSLVESLQNIALGMAVALLSQLLIFPMFEWGKDIPMEDNLLVVTYFTAISIARSYIVRRHNNRKTIRLMAELEAEGQEASEEVYGETDEHELINERIG